MHNQGNPEWVTTFIVIIFWLLICLG